MQLEMIEKYPLPVLIKKLKLAKSSYYYQKKRVSFAKKHKDDYQAVATIFHNNKERYGYRRIKIVLNREGYTLSEKVIRQIMRENGLVVKGRKARKYCSYKGEISPEVPNVIRRNFRADKPNQKWLTDVTEFSIPAGKVYLSPIQWQGITVEDFMQQIEAYNLLEDGVQQNIESKWD
jgi:putative transposase